MKILAASDIHNDKKSIDRLVEKAEKENVDLILLCGDVTFFGDDSAAPIGSLKKLNKRIIIIPGNHEQVAAVDTWAKQYAPGVYNLHGRSIMLYNEIGIFGCGGGNIGAHEIGDSELKKLLEKAHDKIKSAKKQIMMVHMPPYGTNIDALWGHMGSKGVMDIIKKYQPDLVLCGHIHETFGESTTIGKTKVFNVGPKGKIIEIEKKD